MIHTKAVAYVSRGADGGRVLEVALSGGKWFTWGDWEVVGNCGHS